MEQTSLQRARKTAERQVIRKAQRDDIADEVWPARMPSSVRRYQSDVKMEVGRAIADVQPETQSVYSRANKIPARRTAAPSTSRPHRPVEQPILQLTGPIDTDEIVWRPDKALIQASSRPVQGRNLHWLTYLGLFLLLMIVGWGLLSTVANWWQITVDDWHYGRPRTYQTDQIVGHNDSANNPSHFIVVNLNRHVQVIEFPGGDSSKVKLYTLPVLTGQGQDLAPATLLFKDLNGDGKLDMVVCIQDSRFPFLNDNGQFRAPRVDEHLQL
ncbi:hypothetical protein [Tengunoibacter tsumagoiensis]|uniref:VCBS repeat-containing protein n=1 Tax=Tengunoibacter tsumagoiensis TaxID=2014871 RepID=A0A401ZX00_9CHLR|nr:hypothetical protein [Tengunoibacter tsumagoiensis]GCE11393.1 hypothetical protein KTT_12520 [Tengunoibacter tsumagoiensis]